ncbi:MAG: outer membrane lipoprotein carrier protein LolA [Bacteroidota bacterium]
MIVRTMTVLAMLVLMLAPATRLNSGQKPKLNAAEVLEKVQDAYSNVEDATASFTQSVSLKYAKIEQAFTGTVMMKKGNRYRIESQEQTLVTDGKTVWMYSPVNKQVLIDSYKETPDSFSPERFLVGLPKNFRAALVNDDGSDIHAAYTLKLSPKPGVAKYLKSLKVWVDDTDWSIRALEYIDVNETRTVYSLKDVRFNTGIPDERFIFAVPEHVEVIDMRSNKHNAPH